MNNAFLWQVALVGGAYLLGSISSAVIVSRLLGLPDPRSGGSGNPGATNVLRLGGKKAGALTLVGDVVKGAIPVVVARSLDAPVLTVGLCALAAFCGHLFPIFFGFRGGKGVATLFGAIMALSGALLVGAGVVWLAVAGITRFASLASLLAAAAAVPVAWWLGLGLPVVLALAAMALLTSWRHAGNISRLVAGTERKIGQKSAARADAT